MEISILTPKCTLVPSNFFEPTSARDSLAEVVLLKDSDTVDYVELPQYGAYLLFCPSEDDSVSRIIDEAASPGEDARPLPELYYVIRDLDKCREYNKILCTWMDGNLYMAIAQGKSLLLANSYRTPDFTTAEYYIFLAMKSLQLNPEVSTICWRKPVGCDEEMSLYRYFKAVEQIH